MPISTGAFIVVMAFLTAALSGVFGMAGGLALKGALARIAALEADNARLKNQLAGALRENAKVKKDLADAIDDKALLKDLAAKKQR